MGDGGHAFNRHWLHRLQRVSEHRRPQDLGLFGLDANTATIRHRAIAAAAMDHRAGDWIFGDEALGQANTTMTAMDAELEQLIRQCPHIRVGLRQAGFTGGWLVEHTTGAGK